MELITNEFRKQALALPLLIERELQNVETVAGAKELLDKTAIVQEYAKRLKATQEIQKPVDIAVLKVKAKIGELCPATPKEQTGRGHKSSSAGEPLFAKESIAAYRKIHQYQSRIDEYAESSDDVSQTDFLRFVKNVHVSRNSGNDEWYTPSVYIEAARAVMGSIDIDPASNPIAQRTVKAKKYYTEKTNGLDKEWAGNVWLNPPYSSRLVGAFIEKLAESFESGDTAKAIVLVNNATDTKWFQTIAKLATALCFHSGRIRFLDGTETKNSPLQGQVFICLGASPESFKNVFKSFGLVVTT